MSFKQMCLRRSRKLLEHSVWWSDMAAQPTPMQWFAIQFLFEAHRRERWRGKFFGGAQ